jgi:hypothetical protein
VGRQRRLLVDRWLSGRRPTDQRFQHTDHSDGSSRPASPDRGTYASSERSVKPYRNADGRRPGDIAAPWGVHHYLESHDRQLRTQFQGAGTGQVIALDRGMSERIYCNGANVKFNSLGAIGRTEIWARLTAMPAWVTACTVPPYLLCDGSSHNFSDYRWSIWRQWHHNLWRARSGGRVPPIYDGTGSRITSAGCGINGRTIGAAADNQSIGRRRRALLRPRGP